jgi:hypothetical protein
MSKRFYVVIRDLHLYLGLFISPFVVLFALSVFFLVHAWAPPGAQPDVSPAIQHAEIPAALDQSTGREQIAIARPLLDRLGVQGEVSFIRRIPKEHLISIHVAIPGRETTVDLNTEAHTAAISRNRTGLVDAIIYLHKMPGPHNAAIRGNSFFMNAWRWLADVTVYLVLFLTISGVYLWAVLRAERRIGLILLSAGAISFFGGVYALVR